MDLDFDHYSYNVPQIQWNIACTLFANRTYTHRHQFSECSMTNDERYANGACAFPPELDSFECNASIVLLAFGAVDADVVVACHAINGWLCLLCYNHFVS